WDGFVPFVMGTPVSIPNLGAVRMHALRVLRMRDKFPCIVDAIDPGAGGDMSTSCDLNEEERTALEEATRLGVPPRGWWEHATLTIGAFTPIVPYIGLYDPAYFDDYWTLPGYLGHDDPTGSVAAARILHDAT